MNAFAHFLGRVATPRSATLSPISRCPSWASYIVVWTIAASRWVNTKGAKGEVRTNSVANIGGILRILGMLLRARLNGSYKRTVFFSPETGAPVANPKVLSRDERESLMQRVGQVTPAAR